MYGTNIFLKFDFEEWTINKSARNTHTDFSSNSNKEMDIK